MTAISRSDGTTGAGDHIVSPGAEAATLPGPKRRKGDLGYRLAVGWLVLVVFVCFFGDWLWFVKDPGALNASSGIKSSPSGDHWMGTDALTRDMFARVVSGGRESLLIGGVATLIGMVVGGLLGLVAGYFRGWVDSLISAATTIIFAVPALVLVLFVAALRANSGGQSRTSLIAALSVLAIPPITRIVRASSLQWSEREFVQAARVIGAKNGRILFRTVLPNVVPALVSFAFLALGITIVVEAGLAAIGGSIPEDTWGKIINEGRGTLDLQNAPHIAMAPSLVLFLTVLALNWVGDSLVRKLDIREALL